MSNITKTIKKNVKKQKDKDLFDLYYTLAGSIVLATGIVEGRSEEESLKLFKKLRDNNFNADTIIDAVKSIQTKEDTINYLALVYDENNVLTPFVTVFADDAVWPLYKSGLYHGILSHLGKPNIIVERLVENDE